MIFEYSCIPNHNCNYLRGTEHALNAPVIVRELTSISSRFQFNRDFGRLSENSDFALNSFPLISFVALPPVLDRVVVSVRACV